MARAPAAPDDLSLVVFVTVADCRPAPRDGQSRTNDGGGEVLDSHVLRNDVTFRQQAFRGEVALRSFSLVCVVVGVLWFASVAGAYDCPELVDALAHKLAILVDGRVKACDSPDVHLRVFGQSPTRS
jgi:hypothetical protein